MCGMSHSDLVSFSTLPKAVRAEYKTQLFNFLSGLETWYPDFPQWYVRLFAGDDLAAGREIFLCILAGKIAGAVILNGIRAVFHRPHPEKVTDKGAVKSVRRLLQEAEVTQDDV